MRNSLLGEGSASLRIHNAKWNKEASMKVRVQCYSGRKADERPIRFQLDARDYVVEEVIDQWYGPSEAFFKVRADDGNLYILKQDQSTAERACRLESFRAVKQ
jgi:hypothetical protein